MFGAFVFWAVITRINLYTHFLTCSSHPLGRENQKGEGVTYRTHKRIGVRGVLRLGGAGHAEVRRQRTCPAHVVAKWHKEKEVQGTLKLGGTGRVQCTCARNSIRERRHRTCPARVVAKWHKGKEVQDVSCASSAQAIP